MKTLFKTFSAGIVLSLSILLLTASTTPGYDENGKDINECLEIGTCPEGYTCINTPGSYLCEGENINFEIGETSTPSAGQYYFVIGTCIGVKGICSAQCTNCNRIYSALLGKAYNVSGICVCGETTFIGL